MIDSDGERPVATSFTSKTSDDAAIVARSGIPHIPADLLGREGER
ncbi:hypothetical protein [Sphingosinicella sp. CPCC 101087]|nr:hypothetical protein [Sphingosinicella sp. CPCC 101087]